MDTNFKHSEQTGSFNSMGEMTEVLSTWPKSQYQTMIEKPQ